MPKRKSLCLHCRSHMCFRYNTLDPQERPIIAALSSCKKGQYKRGLEDEANPDVIFCSEFENINPGVTINAYPPKLMPSHPDFMVQAIGKPEHQLYASLEGAMEAAADLLKQELIKHKGDSHIKT